VAWHGRIELWTKGVDVLLDAWAALQARAALPERRLLLIGNGADREILRTRLHEGPEGVIWIDRYLLDRAQLGEMLAAADLYVFPSRHEGFAVAPLEAMAAGLPVIATAAPGVHEILPEGRHSGGIVLPVGDAPALAAALAELIEQPEERQRLSRHARCRVAERFSYDAVGRQLRRVLLQET
jgi:starch synthase